MKAFALALMMAPAALAIGAAAPAAALDTPAAAAAAPAAIPGPPPGKGQVIFWRPGTLVGAALGCGVNMGDQRISALGRGKYFVLNLDPGTHGFNARSEARDDLTLEVEAGETYYVRCTIRMGFMVGRPNLAPSDAAAFNEKRGDLEYVDADDHGPMVLPDPAAATPAS